MKPKILIFGNPLVEKDNLALRILPRLKESFPQTEFKEIDPTENLEAEIQDKKLRIIDVVQGIKKITIINNIDKLQIGRVYSIHDFDLAYNLKLLKKIGELDKVEIIAMPQEMEEEEAIEGVKKLLIEKS